MTDAPLKRTCYRDPDNAEHPIKERPLRCVDIATDMEGFTGPLMQAHGSALHGWGVATGLGVQAARNAPGLTVFPGVAVDGAGRHVCLIAGGQAEVWPTADVEGTPPHLVKVEPPKPPEPPSAPPDTPPCVTLATDGLSGDMLLTVEFWETFDRDALKPPLGVSQYNHTPWLRLLQPGPVSDDVHHRIVLARVTLAAGLVTALSADQRRPATLSAGAVTVRGAGASAAGSLQRVEEATAGELRPHAAGGLALTSPTALVLSAPQVGVGVGGAALGSVAPKLPLDVSGAVRARGDAAHGAGTWLYQSGPGKDQAFVGMNGDGQVGLFGGAGAGWGLTMDTTSGRTTLASATVNGALTAASATVGGALAVNGGASFRGKGGSRAKTGLPALSPVGEPARSLRLRNNALLRQPGHVHAGGVGGRRGHDLPGRQPGEVALRSAGVRQPSRIVRRKRRGRGPDHPERRPAQDRPPAGPGEQVPVAQPRRVARPAERLQR
jgi:hypothetical protein